MLTQGKIWGKTTQVYQDKNCEVHYLVIDKGGYCSKHKHKNKWNLFFLIAGTLKVTTFNDSDIVDETILTPGMLTIVSPGQKHMFEALDPCQCLEVYWTELDPNDIERDNQGGRRDEIWIELTRSK